MPALLSGTAYVIHADAHKAGIKSARNYSSPGSGCANSEPQGGFDSPSSELSDGRPLDSPALASVLRLRRFVVS